MRVLIVEDERRLADALGAIMEEQKYTADVVYNGQDGLDYALCADYDVIILDVMLPELNGYEVVHELRRRKKATPVMMLTARDELSDKIKGLDSGADDYMTKPFAPEELLARVRALSRRQGDVVLDEMRHGDLVLDLSSGDLKCGAKSVHLGYKEFAVMRMLLAAPGATVSKEDLIVRIWGTESGAEDNNVEAYISFLRKKLAYLGSAVSIGTLRKVGYRLEDKTV